jgi:hypothetical protein
LYFIYTLDFEDRLVGDKLEEDMVVQVDEGRQVAY